MLNALSGKAIFTKSKAMYGRMLTVSDYEQLMHKSSVPDCAAYLKSQTHYSAVLRDVQETQIHRGALETLLRREMFERFIRLTHYAGRENRFFFDYFVTKLEIQFIINCVRLIGSDSQNEFMQSVPGYVVPYMTFDVLKLSTVNSSSELMEVLKGTPYFKVLTPLLSDGKLPSLPVVEHALLEYYYAHVYQLVDRQFRGDTGRQLKSLFATQAQLHNIQAIYRLKRTFGGKPEEIERILLNYKGRLPRHIVEELIHAPSAERVLEILSSSRYRSYFHPDHFRYIEYSTGSIRYNVAKRYLTFSQSPPVAFVAFMILNEIEIDNIINIIEGVRYRLDVSSIRPLLILGGLRAVSEGQT